MTAPKPHTWSIRRRVLTWLFAGMALVFTANLVSGYYGNRDAADSAYDHLLLASASAIAERTALGEQGLRVDLPYVALDMLATTVHDRVFYAVSGPDGDVVTGYENLPAPPKGLGNSTPLKPQFYNAVYKDAPVRIVALRSFVSSSDLSGYAMVRVAQTRGEREALALGLLRQGAIWTLLIAVSGGVAAWLGISIGLRPLDRLGAALGRRSPEDVRPVLHDVPTELVPLVGAVNGMLLRIDTGLGAMRRFISDASHQLKTPLAGLQAQTEMALRETDPEAVHESLAKVALSARRTSRLAQQLLSHAKAAEPPGDIHDVDLAQIARETVSTLNPQARSKNIDLGYEGDESALVPGNATLLGEVMTNLADNALRYAPAKTMVTLSVRQVEDRLSFTIDDEGGGIPVDRREEVFERFVRLPGSQGEGCGLGLAIVREIAANHGARVVLEDAEGGGLRVRIDFPCGATAEV
jgi:two-component system sensor histidine kinase TctE